MATWTLPARRRPCGTLRPQEGTCCLVSRVLEIPICYRMAVSLKCDVTVWDDQVAMFELAIAKFGSVDVVVSPFRAGHRNAHQLTFPYARYQTLASRSSAHSTLSRSRMGNLSNLTRVQSMSTSSALLTLFTWPSTTSASTASSAQPPSRPSCSLGLWVRHSASSSIRVVIV